MAYSGISHAGYLLLGVVAAGSAGSAGAVLFYSANYVIASVCAFAIFILANGQQKDNGNISVFKGFGKTKPFLVFIMAVCLLSLAGIPPLAGFFGKYFLFMEAFARYPWLVLMAGIMMAPGVVYYLIG